MKIRWRVVGIVLLVAGVAAAFSTALAYRIELGYRAMLPPGRELPPPNVPNLAFINATFWYGWALLAIPLVWLCNRIRISAEQLRVAIPVHVVALLLAAFAHVGLQAAARTVVYHGEVAKKTPELLATFSWVTQWLRIYPNSLNQLIDWELFAGAAIIATAHAVFYYRQSQQRALETAHLQARLAQAQLQALQSQLHPHFLFNTLHAISALMHRDVNAADRMLVQLSDLLRMTLNSVSRPEVQLHEEMDFLAKYLQIEQVRLGERLTVEFDVDVDVLDAVVPALVLQPLAENAIKHGIAPHTKPGKVSVGARPEGDRLIMTVTDSGPGPSERALAALSTGIGVSNTRARLAHQFGAQYRFEFHRQTEGFTVLVAIPLRHDPHVSATTAHVA